MASSSAKTVAQYLAELPPERRKVVSAVRDVIRANLPKGYAETMNWGMICYEIPLKRYPVTYNGRPLSYAALAAQKNRYSLYLTCVYGSDSLREWFQRRFREEGKKLDMGKSCVRFDRLEDLSLETVAEAIARVPVEQYIASYEKARGVRVGAKAERAPAKAGAKRTTARSREAPAGGAVRRAGAKPAARAGTKGSARVRRAR